MGSTPACGEETASKSLRLCEVGEHPRVRGGDFTLGLANKRLKGAPPRAGRRQPGASVEEEIERSTPACGEETLAGNYLIFHTSALRRYA